MTSIFLLAINGEKPLGVTGHKIICCGDLGLFLVGGWNPNFDDQSGNADNSYVRKVWKLNFSTGKWSQLHNGIDETTPVEMASHSLALLSMKKIIMFGGSLSPINSFGCSNRVHVFHIPERTWQEYGCEGCFPPMWLGHWFGHSTFFDRPNNSLYVSSGIRDVGIELHCLHITQNSWEWTKLEVGSKKTSDLVPPGRCRHEIVLYNSEIYVFGGGRDFAMSTFGLNDISVFNLTTSKWQVRQTLPDPADNVFPPSLMCFGCVLYGDNVYISGGLTDTDNSRGIFDHIWRLHLPTLQWNRFGTLPYSLWFHSAHVTPSGDMYIFGGCTTASYQSHRSNNVIKVKLGIKRLEQIAWQNILEYTGYSLHMKNDLELRKLGIPQKFIDALRF